MNISADELLKESIQPTLKKLGVTNPDVALLLLATAAHESRFHYPLCHYACRPDQGLGLYRISHQMHWDVWDNFLAFDADLASAIRGLASQHSFLENPDAELTVNINYATAITWAIYLKAGYKLPDHPTTTQLAMCWSKYYRHSSTDSIVEFICNYEVSVNRVGLFANVA